MKTKIVNKKRKILRAIYGTLSFSTALFVFQACYGSPEDFGMDLYFEGVVKSKSTNIPISGIKVSLADQPQYEITDSLGRFGMHVARASEYNFRFEDTDSIKNGAFFTKDTTIKYIDRLNIFLDAK